MIKLSRRLQTIADQVTQGARVADIGSDHALLPVYLIQSGRCPSAIAGELNTGPYQAARKQTAEAGLKAVIEVRQGDGLSCFGARRSGYCNDCRNGRKLNGGYPGSRVERREALWCE